MNRKARSQTVARALLRWYGRAGRDLPWRRTRDPYAIWVSEIMLQQTQVATVEAYYARFLDAFPNMQSLAAAPIESVLKAWEGLGYYSRARNLHRAAEQVVDTLGGELPADADSLRKLPGIGRCTAGAIASIAFGLDEPVLDGNVARVLCRIFRIRDDPKSTANQRKLWSLARTLIPPGKASALNQAFMDLGATVCVPRSPDCPVCPVKSVCEARARNEQTELPAKTKRPAIPHHDVAVGVVWKRGRILIDRRRPQGMLGGMWEFPGGKLRPDESLAECVVREVREELGVKVEVRRRLPAVKHAYTHFRVTLHAFECDYVSGRPKALGCAAWKWVKLDELDRYAFPKGSHKVIELLRRGVTVSADVPGHPHPTSPAPRR